ncbi:MAG: enoyl-CoA hydratase-related protein [Candidatus Binatia bacterium]|nr:enoyl-CoA hydratase-related protein [Candidatus Binatia bacterium]
MEFKDLRYEKDGHILTITLDRPERMNALNQNLLHTEIPAAFALAAGDTEVRVVILTGAGEKVFCAGADMKDTTESGTIGGSTKGPYYRGSPTDCLHDGFDKPVIVAINGMCLGAGLHFIADGDLILAAEHATFFDTHVKIGQVFALETIGLARKVPFGEVMRMMLLSGTERMNTKRALELGLVSEVVPGPGLMARARELADTIAGFSPATIAASKRALWQSLDQGLNDALERGWREIYLHWSHPDSAEGPRAFAAKRKPDWKVDEE